MLAPCIDLRSSLRFDKRPAALTHELAFPLPVFLRTDQAVVKQRYNKVDRERQNIAHRNQTRERGEFRSGHKRHRREKTDQPKNDWCSVRQLLRWAPGLRQAALARSSILREKQAVTSSCQVSQDSASRFIHPRSVNQRRLLQVGRIAIWANHMTANADLALTVPSVWVEVANFQKVSGIQDAVPTVGDWVASREIGSRLGTG